MNGPQCVGPGVYALHFSGQQRQYQIKKSVSWLVVSSKGPTDRPPRKSPNAVPEMTVSSGGPSGWSDGLGALDGGVEFELPTRKRLKRPGFNELAEWVLGAMLGVEDREGGIDAAGVSKSFKPPGNTIL